MNEPLASGAPLPPARRRRHNPLPVLLGTLTLVGLGVFIGSGTLRGNLEYFVTPTEYQQQRAELQGRPIRMGGLVRAVKYDPRSLNLNFIVTDGGTSYPVRYTGAVSDLFKENQGVVVRGQFEGNTFQASELIVKHSEEYKVPKSQDELKSLLRSSE